MAPHPRVLRTHLPYHKAPVHPKSKCIYISRNPFDTAVSLFDEIRTINEFSGTFSDFFTYFLHGQTDYNDYFEHHKGWIQRKSETVVLWITYEDLLTYPRTVIKQIGDYMGGVYQRSANDAFILKETIKHSNFPIMKTNESVLVASNPNRKNGYSFFRKGELGDYKNFFTEEQIKALREKFFREFRNTNILTTWDKYILPISSTNHVK